MRRFLAAMRFLTILPVPGGWGTAEKDLAGSVPFFPIVGLIVGGLAALAAWGLGLVAPPMLTSAIVVVALLAFSGGLHMDGLSDTADGFLSSRPRERILEIMKDSHVGAMGVIAIVCVLLVKFAGVASLRPGLLWPAALLMPLCGRCAIVVNLAVLPYAKPTGLGQVFRRGSQALAAVWACAVLGAACWALLDWPGLVVAAAAVAAALVFALLCYRKIGGATGDTYGAACELAELTPAVILAAWPAVGAGPLIKWVGQMM